MAICSSPGPGALLSAACVALSLACDPPEHAAADPDPAPRAATHPVAPPLAACGRLSEPRWLQGGVPPTSEVYGGYSAARRGHGDAADARRSHFPRTLLGARPLTPRPTLTPPTPDGPDRVRVLVRFAPHADRAPARALIAAARARVTHRYRLLPDLVAVRELPAAALAALAATPGVVAVLPDRLRHADLAESVAVMHATPTELSGFSDGTDVRVCVLDSGIHQTHPAFAGAVAAQYDFVNDDAIAQDDHGHGSNVAGIVASRDPTYTGVAPGASLLVAKVLAANGGGFDADIIAAIEWCTLDVAGDVCNMSLGGDTYLGTCDFDPLAEAVNASVDAGVVHVIAAGNAGNANALSSPACANRAIAVAAVYDAALGDQTWCLNATCSRSCTDSAVVADDHVCFSNRSMKVELAAPGSSITAPMRFGTGFSALSGTSQATPHVAGLVALLLAERPELRPNEVRLFLRDNATDLGPSGFDVAFGHGRAHALATLSDPRAVLCTPQSPVDACDDLDPCTRDTCVAGRCAHLPACDDRDASTADSCDAGDCLHTPLALDDQRACTTDTFDACLGPLFSPSAGGCHSSCASAIPLPIGATVSGTTQGAAKTFSGTCPGIAMPGADVVYRLSLRPDQPVTFTLTPTTAWDPALYLLAGTSPTTCDASRCVGGMDLGAASQPETLARVRVPTAGDYFLIVDSFASAQTGTFTLAVTAACDPEDEGSACDDANPCTEDDVCLGTLCLGVVPPECVVDADCDDGDLCNGLETCDPAGRCLPTASLVCDDHNPCTDDACDPTLGCLAPDRPDGTSCDDGDVCDGVATCQAGHCQPGAPPECDDQNPCTADRCDPALGCLNPARPDGANCDDGDPCTGPDRCLMGTCASAPQPCPSDHLVFATRAPSLSLPGLAAPVADEDLVRLSLETAAFAPYFDGSPSGLRATAIAAIAFERDGSLVLAFTTTFDLPGLVGGPAGARVETRDLVRYAPPDPSVPGTGTFTFYFDGSDVGLNLSAESIDALAILPDGSFILSTAASATVYGVSALRQDLMRFSPTSLGAQTRGTWSLYLDGSDVGLDALSENIDAVSVLADGSLLLSTTGDVSVPGLTATNRDVLRFVPTALGPHSAGVFERFLDAAAAGIDADIGALELRAFTP